MLKAQQWLNYFQKIASGILKLALLAIGILPLIMFSGALW